MFCFLVLGFQGPGKSSVGGVLYSVLPCVSHNDSPAHTTTHNTQSDKLNPNSSTINDGASNKKAVTQLNSDSAASNGNDKKTRITHQQLQIQGHHLASLAPSSAKPPRKKWGLHSLRIKRSASDTSMKTGLRDRLFGSSHHHHHKNNNHLQLPPSADNSPLKKSDSYVLLFLLNLKNNTYPGLFLIANH